MTLLVGDCREVMQTMADNSVDAIVTDPPYELGFMGKSWDSTGVAYDVTVWQECLRVLKPGGHLLAFGGSRTYHRLAVAIEDAGFQIRDQIMWVYGSGFPKSLNIGKAIDKASGAEREVVSTYETHDIRNAGLMDRKGSMTVEVTAPATAEAKEWEGWGTALKPAHEPIVMARKPLDGTVANNVLTHGVGGINIDGSRIGNQSRTYDLTMTSGNFQTTNGGKNQKSGTTTVTGRFPANFIHDGSDEVLQLFPDSKGGAYPAKRGQAVNTAFASGQETEGGFRAMGDSGSAARFFYCAKASKKDRNEGLDQFEEKQTLGGGGLTAELKDDGSYETASAGGKFGSVKAKQTNHHPTVKPTDLMRYLCRLVTPPNGTVLDPFLGSGSTGKAATLEGFNFIGIEQSAEYAEIANARINHAKENK
jgi:site-specific DNA-methyltransferase (adenine-specific)